MQVRIGVLLVIVFVAWAGAASAASAASWTKTRPQQFFPDFVGVGASSATDVWAVGENDADFETPVAEHWNGSSWRLMLLYNLRPDNGGLFAVSALSASDAWAVGWEDTPAAGALAMFWNGSSWTVVPTPAPATGTRTLESVSAVTRTNVWAVGGQSSGALTEHWNGSAWKVVAAPGAIPLTSVKAVSAANVWAVGGHLVEHYNGKRWVRKRTPVTRTTDLTEVSRVPGTTHLWAVGSDTATGKPVAIAYNGSRWIAHNPPGRGSLGGVAALGPHDVWACGSASSSSGAANYTVHWNGSAWSLRHPAGLADGWVENMTRAPGSTQLWAVGLDLGTDGPFAAVHR
jgi:hypothetical protein